VLSPDDIRIKGDSGVFSWLHEPEINKKETSYTSLTVSVVENIFQTALICKKNSPYVIEQDVCKQTDEVLIFIIFWEITPCGSYKNRRFGGSYRLHLQGARVRAGYRAKL
jgi:hypothetical protein